jgi:hypothetical protein
LAPGFRGCAAARRGANLTMDRADLGQQPRVAVVEPAGRWPRARSRGKGSQAHMADQRRRAPRGLPTTSHRDRTVSANAIGRHSRRDGRCCTMTRPALFDRRENQRADQRRAIRRSAPGAKLAAGDGARLAMLVLHDDASGSL